MRGYRVHDNELGFRAVWLHYSADPAKDVQADDQALREGAQKWLMEAKRAIPDPNQWQQEMEISWWVSKGTRVFPQFQESIHAPLSLTPNPRRVLYRAWDFGYHAPACLIASVDSRDRLLVLREVVGRETNTREFAQRVLDVCAQSYGLWGPGYEDFCDPAGQQLDPMGEKSEKREIEVLQSLGIYPKYEFGWSRKDGRGLIHQLLVLRTDNTPGILVDPHNCPTVMQAFLGKYVFPEQANGKIKDEPDESNHPWSDVQAALRYLCTGLYSQLGLKRFRHMPIIPAEPKHHGYGTPLTRSKR